MEMPLGRLREVAILCCVANSFQSQPKRRLSHSMRRDPLVSKSAQHPHIRLIMQEPDPCLRPEPPETSDRNLFDEAKVLIIEGLDLLGSTMLIPL